MAATPIPETSADVRSFLEAYTPGEAALIECILSQPSAGPAILAARIEQCMGQRSGEQTPEHDLREAAEFVLSALVECHDGPHTADCPFRTED